MWKPLETIGIYTLSLHSGTTIEKQIHRLASQPNFSLLEYKICHANTGRVQIITLVNFFTNICEICMVMDRRLLSSCLMCNNG